MKSKITCCNATRAFGEVYQNLTTAVLARYHIPDNIIKAIMSVYQNFASTIASDSFTTPFLRIKKGILQGDCLSPLVFN